MEWLKNLSNAIEYIEDNLDKEISYEEAARIACCSTYYFQRLFSYVAGVPLSEYIHKRRMSQAAFELQRTDKFSVKVTGGNAMPYRIAETGAIRIVAPLFSIIRFLRSLCSDLPSNRYFTNSPSICACSSETASVTSMPINLSPSLISPAWDIHLSDP